MGNVARVEELMRSKKKGEEWVEEALPVIVSVVREIRELEAKMEEEKRPLMDALKSITNDFSPSIKELEKVDRKVRDKILECHLDESEVRMIGVGKLIFPLLWGFDVVDVGKVPSEFLTVDGAKVRNEIKSGVRRIPGLKIDHKRTLQVWPDKSEK